VRVVDTSAWIEWVIDTPIGRRIGIEIPDVGSWIVPTIVQYELSRWLTREVSDAAADIVVLFSTACVVVPLDTRLALRAAEHARLHALSVADAIIYATASEAGADLLTCDAHFSQLPDVVYFAKTVP
jgi:predicted nucleic acid-binding protein